MSTLSQADVARLMTDPSADVRADTAAKIAKGFEQQSLSDAERRIAEAAGWEVAFDGMEIEL